jgi:hypothetical protein
MFKELIVSKLEEHKQVIIDLHEEIGLFGKGHTFAKVHKHYFWHNKFEDVKTIVQSCKLCQLVKRIDNIRSIAKALKSIPIWDQL